MGEQLVGTVIEKTYLFPVKGQCYLIIETESEDRVKIRLNKKYEDSITIGDRIRFEKPWRKRKKVKVLELVEKASL